MWALVLFLIVGLYSHLAHTDPISTSTVSRCNSDEFVLRVIRLLSLRHIRSDVDVDGTLWKADQKDAQNKSDNAFAFPMFNRPLVTANMKERILQLIDRPGLVKNISSEFILKQELLDKETFLEQRLKTVKDEAIATASKNFQEKLDQSILTLQTKINTISVPSAVAGSRTNIPDTRSENLNPAQCRSKGSGVYYDFKTNTVIGLPANFGNPSGYSVLVTIVPWNDKFGGTVIQIAYAGNSIRMRSEEVLNPYAWTSWHGTTQF